MSGSPLTVNAVENGSPPRAIVILFGWLGSRPKHVQKYAQLWEEKNCSTIYGIPDVLAVMLTQNEKLTEFGLEAAQEAIKLLKAHQDESIPVIIHCCSGAGALVLEQLERCLNKAKEAGNSISCNQATTDRQNDWILLAQAIDRGGEFFDSSPTYLHVSHGIKAIQLGVPNVYMRWMIQCLFILFYLVQEVLSMAKGQPKSRPQEHWEAMEQSEIASRQFYIYSAADVVLDCDKLEELIALRSKKPDAQVRVKKFHNAQHCAGLVQHAAEYKRFVAEFLASIEEQTKQEKELLQLDPDMSEYQMEMD